jgi:20S proteasome subunit alpha 7
MHKVHEEDGGKPFEIEMAWISDDPSSGRRFGRVPKDLQQEAERAAKAALEAEDMED